MLISRPFGLLAIAFIALPSCAADRATTASQPKGRWWSGQVNVVTWAELAQSRDARETTWMREVGADIADRGISYGSRPGNFQKHVPVSSFRAFHGKEFKVTCFLSTAGWNPEPSWMADQTRLAEGMIDDGCDGIHFDIYNQPATSTGAVEATEQISSSLRAYALQKYGRNLMFTGNLWRMIDPFSLETVRFMDVAWIESYGTSDLDVVREARIASSLGNYTKPVWYHYQPDDDDWGAAHLENLPKALFSSCLFEQAVFLSNYKYPVFDTVGPDLSQFFEGEHGSWQWAYANPSWRSNVIQYDSFARRYRDYLIGARPRSETLFAFRPEQVEIANPMMTSLLQAGIDFNVFVYGDGVGPAPTEENLTGVRNLITPDLTALIGHPTVREFASAEAFLQNPPPKDQEFVSVQGGKDVLARLMVKGGQISIFLKHFGYTMTSDRLAPVGPLTVSVLGPNVKKAFYVTPEYPDPVYLPLTRTGNRISFTIPKLDYFGLIVLR